jgi:formylglycine-generating enzyme required for sulfatase activity
MSDADLEAVERMLEERKQGGSKPEKRKPEPTSKKVEIHGDVGPGTPIGGEVHADKIAGRDIIEKIEIHHGENAVDNNHADLEESYLHWLFLNAQRVSLGGISLDEANASEQPTEVTLDAVYVALNTHPSDKVQRGTPAILHSGMLPGSAPLLPALEAVRHNPTLVLLGDPGSGKSTFINFLAMCLAGAQLEPKVRWMDRLRSVGYLNGKADWPHGPLLPVRVLLRDFGASLPADAKSASADLLWEHIACQLAKHDLADYAPRLQEALRKGKCMVLFDGLDEIPDPSRRRLVRDAVQDFAQVYARNRFVVTCRVLSYTDPAWRLSSFPTARLAPLDDDQVASFIGAWYATLAHQKRLPREAANAKAAELREAATHLRDLAQNPMLLTVMAIIHTFEGTLPRKRARLYDYAVELLMWRWQRTKFVPGSGWEPGIEDQLGIRAERLYNALCEVAWKAHAAQGERLDAADLPAKDVLHVLQGYMGEDWGKAQKFCGYVEERAGLLVGRGNRSKAVSNKDSDNEVVYAFPHRTFQEFLAGCYLVAQRDFSRFVLDNLVPQGEVWREVVLLAAGHLVFNRRVVTDPLDMVNVLCPDDPPTSKNDWRAVWWAGEILNIVGKEAAEQDPVGKRLLPRVCQHLVDLLKGGHLSPLHRAQAADVLGRLGDPREGVSSLEPALVKIPGGKFIMGDGDQRRKVSLPAFHMSRYPVTNAQFWQFIDGGGYENDQYWTDAGWAWRKHAKDDLTGFASDLRLGVGNRPIVGINWYEAMAYAAWLSEQTGKPYRLPAEAEWERAAAGTHARSYPWGDEWHDAIANTQEAGIGHTSAVGAFPQDATPEGIYDMGGNTWEWTLSRDGLYPYQPDGKREEREGTDDRVLRGGSCSNSKRLARCTYRNWLAPDSQVAFIGFRLVISDGPPSLPAKTK